MAFIQLPVLEDYVRTEWIDYNGHMNDAAYAKVFSIAVDNLMQKIGLDKQGRKELSYTIFTLETHLCFLKEVLKGEPIRVHVQLINHNSKLLHLFFEMENNKGERLATSEQMLMGIDTNKRRSAPFPVSVTRLIEEILMVESEFPIPVEVGSQIGIRKRSNT